MSIDNKNKLILLIVSLIAIPIIYHFGKYVGSIIANIYFWINN